MSKPHISIVIATRNRSSILCETLKRCEELIYPYKEIIVIDDGSIDGTKKAVAERFPRVRLIAHERSAGYIPRRNEGAEMARGEIIVSLDDDSYFLDIHALDQTAALFQKHPKAGAIAFSILDRMEMFSKDTDNDAFCETLSRHFIGCGYAVRRSEFLELGGFRDFYVYGGEETDFSLRLMDRGMYIVKAEAIRVFHSKSPVQRYITITHAYAFRNQLCTCFLNEPLLRAIAHFPLLILKGKAFALRHGLIVPYLRAFPSFFGILPKMMGQRKPLSKTTFQLYDVLRRQEPVIDGRAIPCIVQELLA